MKPKLYPGVSDYQKINVYQTSPYICIAPASIWMTKQYPASRWAGFLNQVNPNLIVYIIGAPNDKALGENIRLMIKTEIRIENLCGKLSFLESAALMQGALMNYVNDSAPMHLASATNAPVAAIYCSTVPAFGFGPLSHIKHIIEVQEPLACRPCGLHGHKACPLGHFHCALHIRDEQLLEVLPAIS